MPAAREPDHGSIYRLEIRGTVRQTDLEQRQEALTGETARVCPVTPFVPEGFEGWEREAGWNDLTFYVKLRDGIERIAVVGNERWRSQALMFAGGGGRTAPVEFFPEEAIADAHAWLSA